MHNRRKEDIIIALHDVSLTLPGPTQNPVPILHAINLEIQKGETVSIMGPSGSGKTSLMMLIAGVEQATSGRITVAGEDITRMNENQLALFRRKHIGIVFQNFHLIPTMSALENVSVALELSGHEEALSVAEEVLKAVGLSKRLDHYPEQLSGGEQQRVALARAFARRPSLLLADEPTGNLDSANGAHIMELLFDLKKEHSTTIVLITHDRTLAEKTSSHYVMQDGVLNES